MLTEKTIKCIIISDYLYNYIINLFSNNAKKENVKNYVSEITENLKNVVKYVEYPDSLTFWPIEGNWINLVFIYWKMAVFFSEVVYRKK